jgi:hypothetical protein
MASHLFQLRLVVVLLVASSSGVLTAQVAAGDPDVAKGIRLVEDGDYDAAILTLDNAARRLAEHPAGVEELSRAYLYLGIAYVGKGHEAAARAKFREAVTAMKDLSLSPEEFPPKIIDLFEAAREEALRPGPSPAAAESTSEQGGSKTPLILLGVGGAAAAGIAVAATGGGDGASAPADVPTSTAPPAMRTETFGGTLIEQDGSLRFGIRVDAAGELEAQLNWASEGGERAAFVVMELFDAAEQPVAFSNPTGELSCVLNADVTPQLYSLSVYLGEPCGGCSAPIELRVIHP